MLIQVILLIILGVNSITSQAHIELLTFQNKTIHDLDGIPYMIDGFAIHDMLVVIRKANLIHYGKKINNQLVGDYPYNNQKYSIHELSLLEKQGINSANLEPILTQAKYDFVSITQAFIKDIKAAKKLILSLMNEFCERRNRPNSLILSWAKTNGGNEAQIFNQVITDFQTYDIFLDDLTLFLKDLINSCPKARQQYQEWTKKQQHFTE